MRTTGAVNRVVRNRAAQFGTPARPFIGAQLLPSQDVAENSFTDDTVRYRTVVANAGTRYSPVVLKGSVYTGTVRVELFDIDIGSELSSRDYDALINYLNTNRTLDAVAAITDFLNTTVNMSLEMTREMYRWQCIEKAQVTRRGANNYRETIQYSNPAGHRAIAANAWSDDTHDPFLDIFNRQQLLADKGFRVNRIFSSRNVVNIMSLNDMVRTRVGTVRLDVAGGLAVQSGRASLAQINGALGDEGLPPIEIYDDIYNTQTGTGRFISADVMIFVCTTGRDVNFPLGDTAGTVELLPNTLGYYGVGRAAGQPTPGRVALMKSFDDKPPRIETQGWETSAPVLTEPEAIATITGIA